MYRSKWPKYLYLYDYINIKYVPNLNIRIYILYSIYIWTITIFEYYQMNYLQIVLIFCG